MSHRPARLVPALLLAAMPAGCDIYDDLPGRPAPNPAPVAAANTLEGFQRVWSDRCAGCHGADGTLGAARPMRDAEYLTALGREEMARLIREGVPGTRMPAYGGQAVDPIPDPEIEAFVEGMYAAWAAPTDEATPVSEGLPWAHSGGGDAGRGATIFTANCASCHPAQVPPGGSADPLVAGSVTDPFYLRLVSDQHLRSSIVFGRSDLGMPGAAGPFRGPDGGTTTRPLSASDVDDLVAYLASQRDTWPSRDEREDGAP